MDWSSEDVEEFVQTKSAWMHKEDFKLVPVPQYGHTDTSSLESIGLSRDMLRDFVNNPPPGMGPYPGAYELAYSLGWVHIHFEKSRFAGESGTLWAANSAELRNNRKLHRKLKLLAQIAQCDVVKITSTCSGSYESSEMEIKV